MAATASLHYDTIAWLAAVAVLAFQAFTGKMKMNRAIATGMLLITAFASRPAAAAPQYASVNIAGIPHVKQRPDFCGEACGEMWLRKLGLPLDQDYVFDQSGLDPLKARGCYTADLARALQKTGLSSGQVWHSVAANTARAGMEQQFAALHASLLRGSPSIICMHYNDQPHTTEHFRLITGYDASTDEVIYHEPAIENGAYQRMKRDMLLRLWPLKYRATTWTVVRMPLVATPPRVAATATGRGFTSADYAQHVMKLKKKLPGDGFHIVLQKPFVVVGDESEATVKSRAVRTVKWAVDRIKRDYFTRDPHRIVTIWLFKDKQSYESNVYKLFRTRPGTPYGYYSPTHRALVMNISTGGGTLVHEIVHPFMESNFEACPSWFNEGLASLYEQSRDNNGHIAGSTNWRLRGLQTAIASRRVPSFKTLCATTTREFYEEDPGTNYSQARYLCYYLQEKGLLVKYYHTFRKNARLDPTGYNTLKQVLGEKDMAAFKTRWEKYVSALRYP